MGERMRYEPGTFCWAGLATPDPAGATAFYTSLFGWEYQTGDSGYTLIMNAGRRNGGMREQTQQERGSPLLPTRQVRHPLGCHRPRIPDRLVFDKRIQVLVFACGYRRIADATCSATTLRRRRDEWISARGGRAVAPGVLAAYDRMLGLDLEQLAVDSCTTKVPCGGESAGPGQPPRRRVAGGDVGHPYRGRAAARPAGGAP